MKKILIITTLAASLLSLTACQKPDQSTEQVKASPAATSAPQSVTNPLDVKVLKASYNLPACSGEGCVQVDIQRLQTNKPWINQFLDQKILALSNVQLSEKQPTLTTLQANVDRFVQAAKQDSIARGAPVPYTMQVTPEFLGEKGDIGLFKISAAFYSGGAHGSAFDNYYNLDLKQKKQLQLADLLLPEQQPKLYELVHQQYADWVKQNDLSADLSKYEQDWPFKLTDNFTFSEDGLVLAYGQYEIGPYAVGMPEFTIPYAQLAGIIKPEYLAAPLQLQKMQLQDPQPDVEKDASPRAD
ncbi:MAG: DUF3298 domain-containing protein [Moraxellaceae bacterium]|nr:MAG: DUF3298 domain-containing protein [Moraxellaceae bacterium]